MNILILANAYPSRSQTFIRNHVECLADRGHDVTVLAKHGKKEPSPSGEESPVRVLYYGSGHRKLLPLKVFLSLFSGFFMTPRRFWKIAGFIFKTGDLSVLQTLRAAHAVRGMSFDIVHAQFGPLGNLALLLRSFSLPVGPVATSFRGSDISSHLKKHPRIYRQLTGQGDLFLPVTSAFIPLLKEIGFPESRTEVYYSAIDTNQFSFQPSSYSGRWNLIGVGRLVEKKGFHHALEVVRLLKDKHPGIKLRIVGDGPLQKVLEATAEEKGVSSLVEFTGWKKPEETSGIMKDSHILLGTSGAAESGDIEGIPNVLKEAMAVGCPVVAFDHSGVSDLIENGISGFIVPDGDSNEMAGKVEYMIENYNGPVQEMIREARTRIESEFDRKGQAERAEGYYRKAIADFRKE